MKKKLNVGILGCSSIAKRWMIPSFIQSGKFEITAIASRNLGKAEIFVKEFGGLALEGYDKLLELDSIDAVYISLPNSMHFEWIKKSILSGKHVIAEKSLTCNLEETEELLTLSSAKGVCLFENFMFQFHKQIGSIRRLIEDENLGKIRLLRSAFGFPIFQRDTNIRYKKYLGGGALLDAGAYTLMGAQIFLGLDQCVRFAHLSNLGFEVDFQGSVCLENSEGIISQLSFGFDNFYQNNLEIWCQGGKISLNRFYTPPPTFNPIVVLEKQKIISHIELEADNHYISILLQFHNSILKGEFIKNHVILKSQAKLIDDCFSMANKKF